MDSDTLVRFLMARGFRVQIESNGTIYGGNLPYHNPDFTVVCSPKTGKIAAELWPNIDYYKYIIRAGDVDHTDGLPIHALDHTAKPRVARPYRGITRDRVYVQPCDTQDPETNAESLKAAIKSCRDFGYTLYLRLAKIINSAIGFI